MKSQHITLPHDSTLFNNKLIFNRYIDLPHIQKFERSHIGDTCPKTTEKAKKIFDPLKVNTIKEKISIEKSREKSVSLTD